MISHVCTKSITYSQPGHILNLTRYALSIKSSRHVHDTSDRSKKLVYTDDHIYLIDVYGLCEYAAPSLYAKSLHFAMTGNSFPELCILSLIKIILAERFLERICNTHMEIDNSNTPTGFDTVMDYSQNPELLAHFENPNLSDILMEIFQTFLKIQSFENLNILSCEMPMGQLLDSEYRLTQLDVLKVISTTGQEKIMTVPTPTVSLEHEFFLKELFLFQIQSEYAPMQQHPTSYRVHAYRANVRNTSCIKELRISLNHRGTGPDELDHFLMCPITGLNPEAAESMELCFSMNDSYRVNIECISTIVLSGFLSCTSG
ncbi:hypothetical protein L2E82_25487 [Cichorium intybus]|uniref:Uncharacterized protein n=1 Tax=Cichorium intybus TaxID=13427 RepID=A0ACB9E3L8_CICIN|nr:hypothetical protein L2E82_25487 [Cichorium intybus]